MKLFLPRLKIKRLLLKSCERWSIVASLLLYAVLFSLAKYLEIPLKSDDALQREEPRRGGGDSIVEYLHRLHNLKASQEVPEDYDKDRIQPIYALEEAFHKADGDRDGYLSVEELSKWINAKTQEHIHAAVIENYNVFLAIDTKPKNGLISWPEYHSYFLQRNGLNSSYAAAHNERHRDLSRPLREAIMRDKAAWAESARSDPDHLTLDEFLSFRHPESSHSAIVSLVDEVFRKFDRDGDDVLTEEEFSSLQADDEAGRRGSVQQEERERRREFRDVVDLDGDGRATRREMMTYIDPKNPRHAREEAETLFGLADADGDGRLSLAEIFNKMDLFLGSKMVDTGRSFHDEF